MALAFPRMVEVVPRRRAADNLDPGPLGRILRKLRAERGWNQDDVALRAGFRQPYYSSLETGAIQRPADERLEALDGAFDLDLGTIKGWLGGGAYLSAARENRPPYDASCIENVFTGPRGEIVAVLRDVPDELAYYLLGIIHASLERKRPES